MALSPAAALNITLGGLAAVKEILSLGALVPSLPQTVTNGASVYGTLSAPTLPSFLTDNPLPDGYPWGLATVENTNPDTTTPTAGAVTRNYQFNIARDFLSPDGVNRTAILVNGAFPGPLIEANWGDTFNIEVCNNIVDPGEGTTLHWHGLLQKLTPWYDGVPAVQQCPIAPGKCFTYNFVADQYGTSWYHSHYTAQYNAGLFGPMIIHGPVQVQYDIDIGPVILTDWYHLDYFSLVNETIGAPGVAPRSDNNLINGKMNYNCSLVLDKKQQCTANAGLSKFNFTSGKKHRLRLINAGSEGIQRFTIDGHNMTVMANDFVSVQPYITNMVTLGIGQRTDVIVEATGPSNSAIWMRSDLSRNCSRGDVPYALAAIYYEDANTTETPKTDAVAYNDIGCNNDALTVTVPVFPVSTTSEPAWTQEINITFALNATGYGLYSMNNQTFRGNYDHPVLLLANEGNTSYPDDPEWNVYNFGTNASVRLVVRNLFPAVHPMHLHGHNFNVLAQGSGEWDGKITNIENTQRRDVHLLAPSSTTNPVIPSYIVLQYETNNPGVWPFHCHIAWHVSGGLYINTMEQPGLIEEKVLPSSVNQTCTDWGVYAHDDVVDMIDSGLRTRKEAMSGMNRFASEF